MMKIDIGKIFLTPPKTIFERVVLFLMMIVTFMLFFKPLKFTSISPAEAILLSAMPALSISWGWIVLLRFIYRKKDYCKKGE